MRSYRALASRRALNRGENLGPLMYVDHLVRALGTGSGTAVIFEVFRAQTEKIPPLVPAFSQYSDCAARPRADATEDGRH